MSETLTQEEIDRKRGRPVPFIIAAFYLAFIVMFMGFVYIAFKNAPSVTTDEAYLKGLAYNETIQKAEAAKALGWQTKPLLTSKSLQVAVLDRESKPLVGAVAKAFLVHSHDKKKDRSFDLKPLQNGQYGSEFSALEAGKWTLVITVAKDGQQTQSQSVHEVE